MRVGEVVVRVSYVALFLLLAFAAGDFGLTRESSLPRFQALLGGTLILWLLGCALACRFPRTGWKIWIPAVLLLLLGWAKTGVGWYFERAVLEGREIGFEVVVNPDGMAALLSRWGTVSASASLLNMGTATVLIGGMLMAVEIWRDEKWSRFLLLSMVAIGFFITVFFLLQQTFGAPFELKNLNGQRTTFFVYNYHGNGASFLNLFWPVALAIALFCGLRQGRFWAVWILIPVPMFAALFMNISKAGNVLAVAGLVIFLLLSLTAIRKLLEEVEWKFSPAMLAAVALPLIVIGISCFHAIPWKRWDFQITHTRSVEEDTRIRAYRHFVEMIPDAGWSGFGPGTFDKTYRPYVRDEPKLLKVPLWLAHQDYIQTVVEWGWLGFLLWTAILIPGAFGIARGIFSDPGLQSLPRTNFLWGRWDALRRWFLAIPEANQPILLAGVGTALLLTAIHAAFDFPMQVPSLAFYFLVWTSLGWSLLERRKPLSYEEDDED